MRVHRLQALGLVFTLAFLCTSLMQPLMAQAPAQPGRQAQEHGTEPQQAGKLARDENVLPAPVDPRTYKIGVEDVIGIRVWREPELSGSVVVRPDGKITLPLAGEIEAAGLTPEQLGKRVTEAYSNVLNKPEVIVSVLSVNSKRYFISGSVGRSGPVSLVTPTTVLQALSSAGMGQWAKGSKVIIMRGTERIKFNYNEVIKGKHLEQNIFLQDGDHIYVP